MKELLRTNNLVRLSYLEALLRGEGIEPVVLDTHMSTLEGSANAIPRRLAVREEDYEEARAILAEAGEASG